jgi:hypothetical protein
LPTSAKENSNTDSLCLLRIQSEDAGFTMLVRLAVVRGERKEKPLNQLPPINCSREDDTYDIVRTNERESNDDDANLGPDETSLIISRAQLTT